MLPDYAGGGLVNLMSSIAAACGGKAFHPPLTALAKDDLSCAKNVVLLIMDGVGDNYLRRRGAGGELARRRRGAMTSVFPSTTASAITTTYTGRAPIEHGLTGWFSLFGAAGCVGSPLAFTSRGDQAPLTRRGVTPDEIFFSQSLFATLSVRCFVVTYHDIVDSIYNKWHCANTERRAYETLDEFVSRVETAVKSGDGRKLIYAYWPDFDRTSHRHGCGSDEAFLQFRRIDEAYGRLIARLSGTESVVIATADHGFIDAGPHESLELPSFLASQLRFPLCGERRVAYCHVHNAESFMKDAKDWLEDRADIRLSHALAKEGWFGRGAAHPRIAERIGDVTLMMRDRYTVKDWVAGEARHLHIGNHGGASEDEMLIPLIMETT
jgi:predicted AlkP superfamily pyrophosphatase or phosphodiesterase